MNEPFNQVLYDARIKYYENELTLSEFINTDYGNSILNYLTFLQKSNNCNGFAINKVQELVKRLLDGMPLTPITSDDLYFDEITNTKKSRRYEWLVELNGEFYDTHAVAYVEADGSEGYREDGNYRSTKKVTLPYYPVREYIHLNKNESQ